MESVGSVCEACRMRVLRFIVASLSQIKGGCMCVCATASASRHSHSHTYTVLAMPLLWHVCVCLCVHHAAGTTNRFVSAA